MALSKGARAAGVTVREGVRVTGVEVEGRRAKAVRTACGQTVEAEVVVNCAGMWARQFGELAGVTVPNQVPQAVRPCHTGAAAHRVATQAAEHYSLITDAIGGVDPEWRPPPLAALPTPIPLAHRHGARPVLEDPSSHAYIRCSRLLPAPLRGASRPCLQARRGRTDGRAV